MPLDTPIIPTLVLSEHFLPDRGGTITWLVQTYSRYEVGEVIVVAGERGDTRALDRALPFKVERIRMSMTEWDPVVPASFWRYSHAIWHVFRSCRRHRIRLLHCIRVLPEGLIAWCVKILTGIPYAVYAHGEELLIGLSSRKLRWLTPRLYNASVAIIANSRQTKAMLEDLGVVSEKICIIHPGVEVAAFQIDGDAVEAIRKRHNLGLSPVLLTLGRLQRRKGQDMVIRALPLIKKRFPTVKYLVVGTGEEHEALHSLAKESGVGDDVIFVGEVPDDERAVYYAACDLFIMPNRKIGPDIEGFGIVFLEAAAAGKPVIGGRSGGTAEAIQEGVTGLRVDGEKVEAIAAAVIDMLVNSHEARNMGTRGRQWVESRFTWDAIVELTRQVAATLVR